MTNHPAMFDMSPDEASARSPRYASKTEPSLKSMISRAVVTGVFGGIALIGLIENADRFGNPEAIHAARVAQTTAIDLQPARLQDALSVQGPRADRLDYGMAPAAPTDLATR